MRIMGLYFHTFCGLIIIKCFCFVCGLMQTCDMSISSTFFSHATFFLHFLKFFMASIFFLFVKSCFILQNQFYHLYKQFLDISFLMHPSALNFVLRDAVDRNFYFKTNSFEHCDSPFLRIQPK